MNYWTVIALFIILTVEYGGAARCGNKSLTVQKDPVPDLPPTYHVRIQSMSKSDKEVTRVEEAFDWDKKVSGLVASVGESASDVKTYQWIFQWTEAKNDSSFSFINQSMSCQSNSSWASSSKAMKGMPSPLAYPEESLPAGFVWPRSLKDFIIMANKGEGAKNTLPAGPMAFGNLEVDNYYSCIELKKEDNLWLDLDLFYPGESVKGLTKDQKLIPVIITAHVYKADEGLYTEAKNMTYTISYSSDTIAQADREKLLLPPELVACQNSSQVSKELPALPSRFSLELESVDHVGHTIDYSTIIYDEEAKIIQLEYDGSSTIERSFTTNIVGPKNPIKVVHDFNHGVQYIIDDSGQKACDVTPISGIVGDAAHFDTRLMRMKTPLELVQFLGSEARMPSQFSAKDFHYVGQRTLLNALADVWIASNVSEVDSKVTKTAYELYFTQKDWTLTSRCGEIAKPQLIGVKAYYGEDSKPVSKTTYHVHDYRDFTDEDTNGHFAWANVDVSGCLSAKEEGFLAVDLTYDGKSNDAIQDLHGDAHWLYPALRKEIAKNSNVTLLRVSSLRFGERPVAKTRVSTLFFTLLEPSGHSASKVLVNQSGEVSTQTAIKNFNETLMKSGVSVKVTVRGGPHTLTLTNKTFANESSFYSGTVVEQTVKKGYTGGSMAVLALFMIIFGAVFGLGAGWYWWKRNQGVRYQVYE